MGGTFKHHKDLHSIPNEAFAELDITENLQSQVQIEPENHKAHRSIFIYHDHLADQNWILVSHIDKKELFAPLYKDLIMIGIFLMLGLIALAVIFRAIQQRENEYLNLQQIKKSRSYFMDVFSNAPVAYISLNAEGNIIEANPAWSKLTGFSREEAIGQRYDFFIAPDSLKLLKQEFTNLFTRKQTKAMQFLIKTAKGELREVSLQASTSFSEGEGQALTHCVFEDISSQKQTQQQEKNLQRTQALLDIVLDAPAYDEDGLLETAMNRMEAFTESQIGFVHFVAADQNEIQLAVWSSNTVNHHCSAVHDNHYSVDKAAIWADCIKTQKVNIVNDYSNAAYKKGLPDGHAEFNRFVSVPIIYEGKVRMIIGVGNAPHDYEQTDAETLQVFGNELYQLILLKRAHLELESSEHRFHQLFEKAPFAYQSLNDQGEILEVNEPWLKLFGLSTSEKSQVINQSMHTFLRPDSEKKLQQQFPLFVESGAINKLDFQIETTTGELRDVEVTGRISQSADGKRRTHCVLLDMTEQRETDKTLRLAAKVFAETGEGIMVTTPDLEIISVNDAFSHILGYEEAEVIGKTPRYLKSDRHDQRFYKAMWREIKAKGIWQGEIWNRHKQGYILPEWLTITELKDEAGEIENYVGVFADITKLKESEAQLDYLAHHDVLTGLINRRRFIANLDYAITHAKRDQKLLAVLMLDLDRFKDVNDSYGHACGDEVLIRVAKMLQESVREVDDVARLGGDEFVVLLEDLQSPDDAARIAKKLIKVLSEPLTLKGERIVSVGCSVGLSLFPDLAELPEDLLQQADSALYLAKNKGRGTYEYYSAEMTEHAQQRMAIESELKRALANNELRVFYQPQINMSTGKLKGVEALVRWQHPQLGLQYPGYFIAVAEESGLIGSIGEWVLQETCRQAKEWHNQGFTDLVYAVNVSSKQLIYTDLFETVLSTLEKTGLAAEQLELEITESTLMALGDEAISLFEHLRGLGIRIAIDDFGTGYSSFAYLKSLPLDVLKVDKRFIDDIPNNETGMQIVNTIISMAHNLHLEVLAEGVEHEVQQRYLNLKGCDYYQGFLTSPALPADEFAHKFLKTFD